MKNKYFTLAILAFISIFAFIIRTYKLSDIPSGFFTDEASIGYNAYTILTKGVDEYGISYPIFFRAFGEFKSPIEIYSTAPSIALFGLNEFSVRLPSAIFGTLTIIAIYFLTKELLSKHKNKKNIALIAAFLLAISPWHIHFSRIAFETTPFVLFTTLGFYFFLKSKFGIKLLFLSVIFFILAIYSYSPARIFIPLFEVGIFCIYLDSFLKHKKTVIFSLALALLLLTPLIIFSLSPSGLSRWQQVNIFLQPPNNETIFRHILGNYTSHFSLDFLFLKGDIGMFGQFLTRHSVKGMGELYYFQFPLLFLGLWYLFLKREKKMLTIIIFWLLLYPVGSMFTIDTSAQATRSIIGVIPFQILSAVGLYYLFVLFLKLNKLLKYSYITIAFLLMAISFVRYLNLYFIEYPSYSSGFYGWQYGYRSIISSFRVQSKNFDEVLITHRFNSGDELLKFYNVTYNCDRCKTMSNPISIDIAKKQLFALRPDDIDQAMIMYPYLSFDIRQTIKLPNGETEFWIGTFVPKHK